MLAADDRPNISRNIADTIRQMIVACDLAPGARINEVQLAGRLGVSRTPLREALSCLASEGALHIVPRRGFFVTPLTAEELRHIYPIRALLDPAALRLAGIPDGVTLAKLEKLNQRLEHTRSAEARISLDDEWHLMLIAGCGNPVLIELIKQFIRRTHRYEYSYLRERHNLNTAVAEHGRILSALRSRDMEGACRELEVNLGSAVGPLLEWLVTAKGQRGMR